MSYKFNINNFKNNLMKPKMDNKANNPYNPYNSYITQQLINYIYSTVELAKFKYKLIEYESDLSLLTTQKYVLSANFNGSNSLLVFTKIKDRFFSFVVDRKTLSYNQSQVNLDTIKIIPVNIRLDNSIYNGTIMDGIYVQNRKSREKVFIMTDVYSFRGQDLTNDNILHKISNITAYLEANFKHDEKINNLILTVNKFYNPTEILKLKSDMEKSQGFDFKGYAFYPERSGTRLIFLDNKDIAGDNNNNNSHNYNNNKESVKHQQYNSTPQQSHEKIIDNKKQVIKYVCKTNDKIYATLEVRKTLQPDVYYVFCTEEDSINGKKVLRIKKLGLALIPNNVCSNTCRNILQSKASGRALMKCEFNQDKNKWIPIEETKDRKTPSLFSDIEKDLDIIIDYCEEDNNGCSD